MTGCEFKKRIRKTAALIRNSSQMIILTGAGISTPSGIPDFRSSDQGLWRIFDPIEVASINSFTNNPTLFFSWLIPLLQTSINAKPNLVHYTLSNLEHHGLIQAIITQNIDSLHFSAGSEKVIEIHGSIREYFCLYCKSIYSLKEIQESILNGNIPVCKKCGNCLKPKITLFGETLPISEIEKSEHLCKQADLIIVIGSSLVVYPAANLPLLTVRNGGKLIINNLSATPLDQYADIILPYDVCDTWDAIRKELSIF